MTSWLCDKLHRLAGQFELWVAGDRDSQFIQRLQQRLSLQLFSQRGKDLGERMQAAITQGLQHFAAVIVVGSDCPFIDEDYIDSAIGALQDSDVVIGPANDGGYVLLGLKQPHPHLFNNITWGTDKVLRETLNMLKRNRQSVALLPALPDIDRPEDLAALDRPELPEAIRRFAAFAP